VFTGKLIAPPEVFSLAETDSPSHADFLIGKIQPINPLQHPNWDALVTSLPNFSFFHGAAWAKVLVETYGYAPNYFVTNGNSGLRSMLPLMEVDSWLTGRRGIALPFTDDCEPLCPDGDSFKKLFQNAIEFGKTRGWKYLECRGGRKFFEGVPASQTFYGHSLDLVSSEEQLFGRLENSTRRAIRKAEKDGVTVEISQRLEAMDIFYSLQCKTRKKHGLPPQPFSFFSNIHKHIFSQNSGIVAVASWQKTPIAASVYFHLADRAIYKYGASDKKFQHLRGSNLVMWEAIKWYLQKGAKKLHLGRTSMANEGLRHFKLGWGASEETIEYFKYDFQQKNFVTDNDKVFGWHNRIFQSLPDFVSRMTGKMLYRHWA
jgi:hypothetical protein